MRLAISYFLIMNNFLGIPDRSQLVQIDEALFYQKILRLTKRAVKARDLVVYWSGTRGEEHYSTGKTATLTADQMALVKQCIGNKAVVSSNSGDDGSTVGPMHIAVPCFLKDGTPGALLCVFSKAIKSSREQQSALKDAAQVLADRRSDLQVPKQTITIGADNEDVLRAYLSAQLAPGVVYQWRLNGNEQHGFDYLSDGCREVFGLEPSEVVESTERIIENIHVDDRNSFNQAIVKSLATMRPFVWSGRYRRGDGKMRWLYATSTPDPQSDGSVLFHGISHDFTEFKDLELARIKQSETTFDAVFENAPVLMWIKDLDGRYLRANKLFLEHLEYSAEQVIGLTDRDRLNDLEDSALESATRECIATGQCIVVDHGINALNGKRVRYTVYPLSDEYGVPFAVCGVGTDITEQKRSEFELRETIDSLIRKLDQRTDALTLAQEEILERLSRAAEYRDDDTGEHINRIARYSEEIAKAAGVCATECEMIRRASPLHDIGKIGIPDSILLKNDSLTEDEWSIMKSHAVIGAAMLAGGETPLIRMAEAIALTHHERWDGSGYPNGLSGEKIPLSGRIVAIADAFDALTSDRPYKEAWTFDEAVKEIEASAHTHFDPHLVEVFLSILPTIRQIHDEFYSESPEATHPTPLLVAKEFETPKNGKAIA